MQQLQAYRASIITAMAAAAILMFACLASAQAQSVERVAQWLLDMLPEEAPNTGNDEFVYGDDMIFLSIFWMSYIPIVMVILWLIGDWLMRRFRKLRASFSSFISTHVQAEPRTATSNGGPNMRG